MVFTSSSPIAAARSTCWSPAPPDCWTELFRHLDGTTSRKRLRLWGGHPAAKMVMRIGRLRKDGAQHTPDRAVRRQLWRIRFLAAFTESSFRKRQRQIGANRKRSRFRRAVADPFRARTPTLTLSYSYFGASLASITARWRARCIVRHDGAGRAHDIPVIVPSGHIAQEIGACLALIPPRPYRRAGSYASSPTHWPSSPARPRGPSLPTAASEARRAEVLAACAG